MVDMNTMPQFGRANVALKNVSSLGFNLAHAALPSSEGHSGICPPENWGQLELRDVTYHYQDEEERPVAHTS